MSPTLLSARRDNYEHSSRLVAKRPFIFRTGGTHFTESLAGQRNESLCNTFFTKTMVFFFGGGAAEVM